MKIDAVQERSRDLGLIVRRAAWRPTASQRGIAEMAAAARVHCRYELDPRWECDVGIGAGDAHAPCLKWLAQRIEHRPLELGQLVQEQDAKVREADLTR